MRPRCFCDRRWRIRAAEGPAGGVKWFSSWRPARVSGSTEVCRRDSTRPRPRHVGASGGGGSAELDRGIAKLKSMTMTKAPTVHGSVTCTRAAERTVISSARPAPVAPPHASSGSSSSRTSTSPQLIGSSWSAFPDGNGSRGACSPGLRDLGAATHGQFSGWVTLGRAMCLTLRCAATRPTAARGTPGVVEGGASARCDRLAVAPGLAP